MQVGLHLKTMNQPSTVYKTLHSRDIDDVMNDVTKAILYHHSVEMYMGSH